MNQKEAVYQATLAVCEENGIAVDVGFNAKSTLSATQQETIISLITQGIMQGEVEMSADARAKYTTVDAVRKYTTGMVGNWFRKDTRLNGGSKYETKNPGSRAGSGDPQLKALKILRALHKDNADALSEIDAAIATRTNELQSEKVKQVVINVEALPESLRKFVL